MLVPADTTRQLFKETATMPKPTTQPAIPKQAAGAKNNPPASVEGGGGLSSRSDHEPKHEVNLPAQEPKHNSNIDRGEPENRDGAQSQEKRNPLRHDSEGVSTDRDGTASEAHFKRHLWDSQVFSEDGPPESSSRYVLLALGYLFNDDGTCWPTRAELAKLTGLGERTIITHLEKVEAAGWISSDRNVRIDGKRAIIYRALRGMLP